MCEYQEYVRGHKIYKWLYTNWITEADKMMSLVAIISLTTQGKY